MSWRAKSDAISYSGRRARKNGVLAQSGTLFSTWAPQTKNNYDYTVSVFMHELKVDSKDAIREALQKMSLDELINFEGRLRKMGAWYLIRIDNKIVMDDFTEAKITIPYILGRMASEGEWLLTCRMDPIKNKGDVFNSIRILESHNPSYCS